MTYTAISMIGTDICAVMDRTVSQCRLRCCRMVVTIYQQLKKLFPQIWPHHHLMVASTVVPIIQQQMSLIQDHSGKSRPRLDASLHQCARRRRALALIPTSLTTSSLPLATALAQSSLSALTTCDQAPGLR